MMTHIKAAAAILVEGTNDWNYLAWARQCTEDYSGASSGAELRDATLIVVGELLTQGLVVAGDVRSGTGFVPWQLDAEASLERIRRAWTDPDEFLRPGDVCWLANTPAGDELAEQLWQEHIRENGPDAQI